MKKISTLQNRLLVAMPFMDDPQFNQAVVYIYDSSWDGKTPSPLGEHFSKLRRCYIAEDHIQRTI